MGDVAHSGTGPEAASIRLSPPPRAFGSHQYEIEARGLAFPNNQRCCHDLGVLMSRMLDFLRDESGASAAEYALILAIIGIGIVVAAVALKSQIVGALERTADRVNTAS